MEITFDLSTLGLSEGTYDISVKARAEGYAESYFSEGLSYEASHEEEPETPPDEPEETYTVSGTWMLNEAQNIPQPDIIVETVNFISNGVSYSEMIISGYNTDGDSIEYDNIFVYRLGGKDPAPIQGWQDEAYRTITFDGAQPVSKEFYEWLVENAVRQTVQLSGTWYFNETPTPCKNNAYNTSNVLFTSNGTEFYGLRGAHDGNASLHYCADIAHSADCGVTAYKDPMNYTSNPGWQDEAYRIITFNGVQTVSIEFYEWLVENAVEHFSISSDYELHGDGFISVIEGFSQELSFVSNGTQYSSISIQSDVLKYDDTVVYSNGKWVDQNYRTVSIIGTQYVTKVARDFLANGGCFIAGTPVLMADGSTKTIENVVVGDLLLTYDETNKAYDVGRVLGVTKKYNDEIAKLTFKDGSCIELTLKHPLYVDGVWKTPAGNDGKPIVEVGDKVLSVNGNYAEITAIEYVTLDAPVAVYNFEVEGEHNYFAGEAYILAHNYGSK